MNLNHRIFVAGVCFLSLAASAQWAWVDKDGKKVFSDRAPGADVPERSVLKRPGRSASAVPALPDTNVDANGSMERNPATANPAASKPASGIDKELTERLKKAEQDQAAKMKVEEDRVARARADNCQRARLALKNLDSGVRMSRMNVKGEREILDDAARAAEGKRLQSVADNECK
jgi:hypothetical protein